MKIGLVYSFSNSDWFSVTKILGNLLALYEKTYGEESLIHINLPHKMTSSSINDAKQIIESSNIDKLIFLDHKPHPYYLLSKLNKSYLDSISEFILHVYGDFTLTFKEWADLEETLKGRKVKFICASDKQMNLVGNLSENNSNIYKIPFPVQENEFYYDQSKRSDIRVKHGIKNDDFVFFYVGRLSKQKRNLETIKIFLELKESGQLDEKCKFIIAGLFDQIGNPFLEEDDLLGEYFRKVMQVVESFDEKTRESVKFLGGIDNTELVDYYNSFDFFLSMSTYHDEDYGMAVAEALCCGLPAIITDWAGYSSFNIHKRFNSTSHVSVKLGVKHPYFNDQELVRFLRDAQKLSQNINREEISKEFHNNFTITSQVEKLKSILSDEVISFSGFNETLQRLAVIATFKLSVFMNEHNRCFNKYYFKVYESYVRRS